MTLTPRALLSTSLAFSLLLTSCLNTRTDRGGNAGQPGAPAAGPAIPAPAPGPQPAPAPNPVPPQAPVVFFLKPELQNYMKAAFPRAALASRHKILDPITEGNVNNTYLRIYDALGIPQGYARDISTTTGCKSFCKPLNFTLCLNNDLSFAKILAWAPLTKLGHKEFTESDYAKLESLLIQNPKSLAYVKEPMDMVDGVTRATKPEYQGDVVPTAAFSTLRIYKYERQTQDYIANNAPVNAEETSTPPSPPTPPTPPSPPPVNPSPLPPAPYVPGAYPAPEFTLFDLTSNGYVNFSYKSEQSEFRGKVTVIAFFGNGCPHCQAEIPVVQKIADYYKTNSKVKFLAVSTFRSGYTMSTQQFVKTYGIYRMPVLLDTDNSTPPPDFASNRYGVKQLPSLFVVDKWGRIRFTPGQFDGALQNQIPGAVNALLQE